MCGIFGISFKAGKISDGRRAVLANNLARLNDLRGGDSWGMYAFVGGKEGIRIRRGLGDFQDSAWEVADHRVLFGHTRWATHGAKTIANAHPFEFGHIVGAHNGVIHNHHELCREYKRNFEVDSMHIFAHLAEGKDFSDLEGYGAIEWVDRRHPNKIFLTRMAGGELSIYGVGADDDHPDGIVWSSNEKHLKQALFTAGLKKSFAYKVHEAQVYSITNGEAFVTERKLELSHRPKGSHHAKWSDHLGVGAKGTKSDPDNHNSHYNWSGSTLHNKSSEPTDLTEWNAWNEYVAERNAQDKENGNSCDV